MKYLKFPISIVAFLFMVFMVSCSGAGNKSQQTSSENKTEVKSKPVEINAEAKALLNYLNETGDYVNSRNFPSLIKASSVYEELEGNNHVIDLRGPLSFKEGHIKGAVKVEFSDIPDYFTNKIKPFEYDRIIVVCYSGQISSYTVSLLRLMGYGNVYAMRWGMSAWNNDFAYQWTDGISSEFQDKLESEDNERAVPGDFPKLNTGKTTGEEIMEVRFNQLFEAGSEEAVIKAEDVFANPHNFYIINYDRKDKYESAHIPGAIRYKPNGTLSIISEMQTIPADKDIVIYCGTGHNSGFVTAYLRLFGYNAKTLLYGNNAFMHDKMVAEKNTLSWLPFTDAEIENYPYEK